MDTDRYDVVVVGARCAGASTALALAQSGISVLMLDAASFPSDTMSTLYIQPRGVDFLRRAGVLDRVLETGCPPIRRMNYDLEGAVISGTIPSGYACAPRRLHLDRILAEAAVAQGVMFQDRCRVVDLVYKDGRVAGIRYRRGGPKGALIDVATEIVIGADGMRSTVASLVGAEIERETAPRSCVYFAFLDAMDDEVHLYERERLYVSYIPTSDGQAVIAAYFPQEQFAEVRRDSRVSYADAVQSFPKLASHLQGVDFSGLRLFGTGDQQNFFRRSTGPGWALIGDAAHHKDSITAFGIADAFTQAELLADAVESTIHDPAEVDRSLSIYASNLAGLLEQNYQATLTMSSLTISPRRRGHFLDVRRTHREVELFKMMEGSSSIESLI